jgi:crotonobetainyl-CoA:carnitine CoA-transferase CaiB-like acyl-CoA transferase
MPSRLGADTDEVLAELGFGAAEIAGLKQRRIV